jgi:hypothetical protein
MGYMAGCPKSRINHKNLHPGFEAFISAGYLSSTQPLVSHALIPLLRFYK